jgi:hypothetical protein
VNHHALVECLQAAAARVERAEPVAHRAEHGGVCTHGLSHHERRGRDERFADTLAARHFADARVPGTVLEQDQIAREEGRVRPAQVEQHAVVTRHRDDLHPGHNRRAGSDRHACVSSTRRISPTMKRYATMAISALAATNTSAPLKESVHCTM